VNVTLEGERSEIKRMVAASAIRRNQLSANIISHAPGFLPLRNGIYPEIGKIW
jgi:hypothetical protein